jgi:hypothetical protein
MATPALSQETPTHTAPLLTSFSFAPIIPNAAGKIHEWTIRFFTTQLQGRFTPHSIISRFEHQPSTPLYSKHRNENSIRTKSQLAYSLRQD